MIMRLSRCIEPRRLNRRRAGFTLVEMLVVIAIIAILASLLLPSLVRAAAYARTTECATRGKQWQQAFHEYATDNGGWIPRESNEPDGVTINTWGQVRGAARAGDTSAEVWYNALPPYANQRPASTYAALSERNRFYEKRNLIHCASARFPDQFNPNHALFSMAMSSQLIKYPYTPTIKLSMIEQQDTSKVVLFLDNRLPQEKKVHDAQTDEQLGQPSSYAPRFSPRHRKGGNLVFADGHVRWFPGHKVVETDEKSPLLGREIVPPREIVWDVSP
jgi:prepilin-type N-terminal cleavage/methylation domain-containing protein/prepilin-type processing-associated H-X9-DG protein